jgi:type IV secretory pathway VirJ component
MTVRSVFPALLALAAVLSPPAGAAEESATFGRFGAITLYRPPAPPARVALFVSGDGGWNEGVVDMARELVAQDTLVVGIDITRYLRALQAGADKCLYPAADLEALSQFVQKKLGMPRYVHPVLVGYSSGATLVYATLAQAPPGTFRGAIGLGFCPDLVLSKSMCRGSGLEWDAGPKGKGFVFRPAKSLEDPFVALQGTIDQVCEPKATETYIAAVPHAEVVLLPKVGHGFSKPVNWLPQFKAAFARMTATAGPKPGASGPVADPAPPAARPAAGPSVADLPLVEVRASRRGDPRFAVIISGDGGWASLDRQVGETLATAGVPVVGLDSLQYFWTRRTPDEAARDLQRIIEHYAAAWGTPEVLLVGYSRGADVLPFLARRLAPAVLGRVQLIALLGPGRTTDFEIHVADFFVGGDAGLAVRPEVEALKGHRLLCVHGDQEDDSLCPTLSPGLAQIETMKGAHHFGGEYAAIAARILAVAPPPTVPGRPGA